MKAKTIATVMILTTALFSAGWSVADEKHQSQGLEEGRGHSDRDVKANNDNEREKREDEKDGDDGHVFIPAVFMGTVIGNPLFCAPYATNCTFLSCCQYFGRGQIACRDGICVQAHCARTDQHCGIIFGDCCFHLGLQCMGNGLGGRCQPLRGGDW